MKTLELSEEQIQVILRGLTFALDMGDTYFAFWPGEDGYSDGDQEKDENARKIAQELCVYIAEASR